jgi:hypothetical protein
MTHLTCSLCFPDGQTVSAHLDADSKIEEGPVSYSGPMERLPFSPEKANAIELRAYFASFARELGARSSEDVSDDRPVLNSEVDRLLDSLKGLATKARKLPRSSAPQ